MWRIVALMALSWGTPAYAFDAAESEIRFERGVRLMKARQFEEALEEFFTSNRLAKNPSATYNIGSCLEYLGRYEEAFSAFKEYEALAITAEGAELARSALSRVRSRVAVLSIETRPRGATVYIDRENLGPHGQTPKVFAVPPGRHQVILHAPDHHVWQRELRFDRGAETSTTVALEPIPGALRVTSEPIHARVVDGEGRVVGVTPFEIAPPAGRYELTAELLEHVSETRTVEVHPGESSLLSFQLRPRPPPTGRVRILSSIDGALVRVDQREAGFTPTVLVLDAGAHAIELVRPGSRAWRGQIEVPADRALAIDATIEPIEQATGRGPWPAVLGAVAVVSAVTGAALGASALVANQAYEAEPKREDFDRVRALNVSADVFLISALLSGTAFGALMIFGEPAVERPSIATVRDVDDVLSPSGEAP